MPIADIADIPKPPSDFQPDRVKPSKADAISRVRIANVDGCHAGITLVFVISPKGRSGTVSIPTTSDELCSSDIRADPSRQYMSNKNAFSTSDTLDVTGTGGGDRALEGTQKTPRRTLVLRRGRASVIEDKSTDLAAVRVEASLVRLS